MHFIREEEFKYKSRNKSLNDKIKELLEILNDIKDVDIGKSDFYYDSDPEFDDSEDI